MSPLPLHPHSWFWPSLDLLGSDSVRSKQRDTQDDSDRRHMWGRRASQCPPSVSVLMIGSVPGGGFAVTVNVASFLFCQLGTELLLNSVSPLGHRTMLISSELWLRTAVWVSCIVKPKSPLYGQGVVQMCSARSHHASVGDAEVSCWWYCTGTVWFIFSLPLLSLGLILSETCECHCAVPWPAFVQCVFIILLECSLLWEYSYLCITSLFISIQLLLSVAYKKDFEVLIGTLLPLRLVYNKC